MAESATDRQNNPFYDSVDSPKLRQEDHDREPGENDPLIRSGQGESSRAPHKCLCTCKGCFITKRWFIFLSFVVLMIIIAAALFTYFPTRKHFIDTYGLPPKPDAEPREAFYGRLPKTLTPVSYAIKVTPYLDEEDAAKRFTFDGEVTIEMNCLQSTKVITLHVLELNVDIPSVVVKNITDDEDGDEYLEIGAMETDPKYDFFMIHVVQALTEGHRFSISMRYVGSMNGTDINGRNVGFYHSSYQTNSGQTRYIASTQLALTNARRMYPSFDEPALKATFDIIVMHRPSRWVISNMPSTRNDSDGDWKTAYFATTEVMSPYLVAIVVSDFECKQIFTNRGTQFRVWSTADNLEATEFALGFGNQSLTFFEDMLERPDPLPKVDMVALPLLDSFGAIASWGLITYQDNRVLVREGVDPPSQRQGAALVIAHELSHAWFGNLVTCAWWNNAWLNEGFARFLEYVAVDHLKPDWQMFEQFYHDRVTLAALMADGTYASHPTIRQVGWYDEIWDQFGKQSYERGAAMFMMMKSFLREEVFYAALKQYLEDYAYKAVDQDDLWKQLTQADAGKGDHDVKAIMDPWLLQLGYPVVTVTRTEDQVTAEQELFLLDPNDEPLIPDQYPHRGYWSIPLTYTDSNNAGNSQLKWLKDHSVTFELTGASADDWLIVNIDHVGYYRVNYDVDNWNQLISQLLTDHLVLTPQQRVALIDDSFNLGQAQRLDFNVSLNLMEYMQEERDFGPWKAAESAIQYIDRMLKRSALYGDFRTFIKTQVSPLHNEMGWNLSALSHVDYHSATVGIRLACKYGHRSCISKAQQLFRAWMADPILNSLNVDIRQTVLCTSILFGDQEDWDAAHAILQNSQDKQLSADIMSALACNPRAWILQNYMELYLHTDQATEIISYVSNATAVGFLLAWDFATEHFDTLLQIDVTAAYDLMWQFTNTMNTQADKDKYDDFGRKFNYMPADSALGFYTGLRKLNTNIQWMDKYYQDVEEFLKTRME